MSEEYSEGPFDIISAEEAAFAPVRFRLMRDMTPEVYDQVRSVVEAMAGWDDNNASELLDRCPWCYADGGRHMRGCVTRQAQKLKKLLPPRG